MRMQSLVAGEATKSVGQRTELLAFVNDAASEEAVRQYLADALVPFSGVKRGNVASAIEYLSGERSPNLLLVDISGSDLPISDINRLADVCEPGVAVIAVGERNDVGLYRDLLQVGVNDYLVKPLTRELLKKALQGGTTAEGNRISQKLGKLVTFAGTRGGVGTTTLAANLAWFLAHRRGRRVALVDLDLQNGDCGLLLNVKPTPGLREALEKPQRIDNLFVDRAMSKCGDRLYVLSGEEPLADDFSYEPAALENLLTLLQAQFHYVIVDVPRGGGRNHLKVLEMAALRVIVADLSVGAIRDTVRLKQLVGVDDPGHQSMVVVNRKGAQGRGEVPVEEFAKAVEMQPRLVIPFQARDIIAAANHGTPVAGSRSRITDAIAELAMDVSGQVQSGRRGLRRLFG